MKSRRKKCVIYVKSRRKKCYNVNYMLIINYV